jgi:hypothetical protein
VTTTVAFNALLDQTYQAVGAPVADVQARFETTNFALTGSVNGATVPRNVSVVCQRTHMCTSLDIHTNDAGHTQLATAFAQVIDGSSRNGAGTGYWLGVSDGGIFNYGDAGFSGPAGALALNKPIVGMAPGP